MVTTVRAVVCLSIWLSVCQVRGSHVPLKMNKTIQNLLQHYKIPRTERFNGKPVFSKEPLTGKTETKMVFMGSVLETYEKLIGHMLKQLPTPSPQVAGNSEHPASAVAPAAATGTASNPEAGADGDVREQLKYLLNKIHDLKKASYQEEEKLLQGLQGLRHIQMDNVVIQSKALWELPWLYEEASSLVNNIKMQRRRRRRQARRFKAHLRA